MAIGTILSWAGVIAVGVAVGLRLGVFDGVAAGLGMFALMPWPPSPAPRSLF